MSIIYSRSFQVIRKCLLGSHLQQSSTKGIPSRQIKRWVAPTLQELSRRKKKAAETPPAPRSSYLEWDRSSELYACGKRLGEHLSKTLLDQAFTSREYVNLRREEAKNKGIVVEELEDNYEMVREGEDIISRHVTLKYSDRLPTDVFKTVHNHLTSTEMLSHVGQHLGLKELILTPEYPPSSSSLTSAFKALVSAVSRSSDEANVARFLDDFLLSQLTGLGVDDLWSPDHPFQYLKGLVKDGVEARLCNQSAGGTILANYQVGIYDREKKLLGLGWGESVDIAKDSAAIDAIYKLNKLSL